jgi:HSP20 family protein
MATTTKKRASTSVERVDEQDLLERWLDDWRTTLPIRGLLARWMPDDLMKVEEYQDDGVIVVRAEMPGIDPERDVDVTLTDGLLTISAERRDESTGERDGYRRREFRYGRFERSLRLPAGVSESDITATYKDGILEIRVPAPATGTASKIAVTRA